METMEQPVEPSHDGDEVEGMLICSSLPRNISCSQIQNMHVSLSYSEPSTESDEHSVHLEGTEVEASPAAITNNPEPEQGGVVVSHQHQGKPLFLKFTVHLELLWLICVYPCHDALVCTHSAHNDMMCTCSHQHKDVMFCSL